MRGLIGTDVFDLSWRCCISCGIWGAGDNVRLILSAVLISIDDFGILCFLGVLCPLEEAVKFFGEADGSFGGGNKLFIMVEVKPPVLVVAWRGGESLGDGMPLQSEARASAASFLGLEAPADVSCGDSIVTSWSWRGVIL